MLEHIPKLITDADNEKLTALPTITEVRNAVFGLTGDSAAGPD